MSRPFYFGGNMKENIKKIIAFLVATIILFVAMYSCGKVVNAEIPATQIVNSFNGTWSTYGFQYNMRNKYYIVQDATGIPTSTLADPNYFYTDDNVTFYKLTGTKLITEILNYGVGVIVDINILSTFLNGYFNAIKILDSSNSKYVQGGLYDSNDNFLGYCLNDITGCYYETITGDPEYTIPSDSVDNVKNYFDTQNITPDYVTFYPLSINYLTQDTYINYDSNTIDYIKNTVTNYNLCRQVFFIKNNNTYTTFFDSTNSGNVSSNKFVAYSDEIAFGICSRNDYWDNFFTSIKIKDNNLLASDMVINFKDNFTYGYNYFDVTCYDSNGTVDTNTYQVDISNKSISNLGYASTFRIGSSVSNLIVFPFNQEVTIYKNQNIKDNLDNQTYYPNYYFTDTYTNYDSNNDNSIQTLISITDNSTNNNNDIYSECNNSYYDYYDNGYYDNSSSTTNITNITNNYYGEYDPNPDPDPDPDPESPVLDEILRAILRFFNAIGDIIGTILASILNLIDSVLEALAGVMENLDGMSDFFSSLFAWLPDPVPQILGAGFGICLICGIIKFIRG